MSNTIPVSRWQLACLFVLLPVRMLRASFILAHRVWRIRPCTGDRFDLRYKIVCEFNSNERPRVVESETTG